MAIDPQPTSFITLRRAFDLYREALGESDDPQQRMRDTDQRLASIAGAFANGDLVAVVNFLDRGGEFSIPQEVFAKSFFPERVFLTDDIADHPTEGWEPYAGRTAFVLKVRFDGWLSRNKPLPPPDPTLFDPMKAPLWTLTMTAGWVDTKSIETVRWQVDEWRREKRNSQRHARAGQ